MKKLLVLFVFIISSCQYSFAQFEFAGDVKTVKDNGQFIELQLSNALLNIYIPEENIIRFRYVKEKFSDAPSYAVVHESFRIRYSFSESTDDITLATAELRITINKNPCRIKIYDKENNIINEDEETFGAAFDGDEVRCFKQIYDDEMFFGLGEKTGGFNRKGSHYTNWNSDTPGYTKTQDPIYQSIPFFIGVRDFKSYGIFLDNTYRSWFNFGAGSDRFYWFGAEKGELDYYFIYGPEIKKVISSYTKLTGRIELPPMWSLGYQQSKWSYYPESAVMELAKAFREREIPCDVIYLDIHHMNGYRVFTWDEKRFPAPENMLSKLSDMGFKVITIIDPGVKADTNYFAAQEGLRGNYFAVYPDGEPYKGEVWPSWSFFPDFTNPAAREWWGEKNADWMKQGIAGIWNDMNEPAVWGQSFPDIVKFNFEGYGTDHKRIHNVYALQMAKATYDGLNKAFPGRRHFILTRAGFSGIQRYSAVWTGDNFANEDHLIMSCKLPLSMGLSGIPFIGSDVGGFMGEPSQELYIRWLQLGAFSPFFRGHSHINKKDQEPFAFGETIERYAKGIITLRYSLLPFIYNEFYNASVTGLPVMRHMFLNYQNDQECYSEEASHQFMIGENLLAAPVLSESERIKKLYLPEGRWMDWWDNKIYEGRQWIVVEAPLDRIPLFIKEGGVIPMQGAQNFIGEKQLNELELRIFPSSNSSYQLYEDDGISTKYKEGDYLIKEINVTTSESGVNISISNKEGKYKSGKEYYTFRLFDVSPKSIVVNDESISRLNNADELKGKEGYYFDKERNLLFIRTAAKDNLNISVK